MIELKQVIKTFNAGRYNAFTAVKGVDLCVPAEKATVFRGPGGPGKTTLLSITGCMPGPTSGRVFLSGRETTSLTERFAAKNRRNTFRFVFQKTISSKGSREWRIS